MRRCVLMLVGLAALLCPAKAFPAERPTIQISRVAEPPVLERYLDGRTIPPGTKISGFVQREPGDGVPISQDTTAYVSYDAEHLYVVFVCKDEPGKVRANLTKREAIMDDDVLAVILDTYHDGQRSYMFLVNPLGIQMDGVTQEGQEDDYSYDTLWKSDGRVTPDGFVALVSIPFKSLRFKNEPAQTWGLALGRIINRNNETSFWPYVTRRIAAFGEQLATMTGIEGVSPGRNLQAIPYGNFAAARILDERGVRATETTGRFGVDAKAVIKDAVTVDLTVNPDFSQVESDEPQVTVNQRFEVFFPEKRPFFIENSGFFQTPENLFFSRRIADPRVGVRVTGKAAGWAFAGLAVDDKRPGQLVDAGSPGHDAHTGIGLLRVRREFGNQSHLGGIVTDKEFAGTSNRVFGVDGRWRVDDNWSITGQWVGSRTTNRGGSATTGSTLFAEIQRGSRNFESSTKYTARSPEFQTDLGYIERVDMREVEQELGYTWHPKNSPVLSIGTDVEASAVWDYRGQLQDWRVGPGLDVAFPGLTEIYSGFNRAFERFEGIEFHRYSGFTHASTQWWPRLNLNAEFSFGTAINYYPAAGLRPFLASERGAQFGFTLKPSSQLRVEQAYIFTRLSTTDGPTSCGCSAVTGGRIFSDHIFRTRVNYQFTRELSLRGILDYEALRPNTALVDLEHERRMNLDVLFTYLVNPWTAVYLGYTDGYENRVIGGSLERPASRADAPLLSTGRQVFVKLSYLLRY